MSPSRVEPNSTTYSGRLAVRIRELRDKKGWTTDEFAERLNRAGWETTPANVRHWENGTSRPNLDALPFIAEALGVKVRNLLPME